MTTGIYRALILLLFAGLLASCGTVAEQEAVEEQATRQIYDFSAQSGAGTLSGELTLEVESSFGNYKSFNGTLVLGDGTQLDGGGLIRGNDVRLWLSSDDYSVFISGFGQVESSGALTGEFSGRLDYQSISGGWEATLKGSGGGSDQTPNPGNPGNGGGDDGNPGNGGDTGNQGSGSLTINISASNIGGGTVTIERVSDGSSQQLSPLGSGTSVNYSNSQSPIAAGDYIIRVEGSGFENQAVNVTVDPGEDEVVDITIN